MKYKLNNNDIYALGGIILLSAGLMIACVARGVVYGSTMDWVSQHYPIPEYFRTLFYETHDIFPSYAPNIGGGESIYNLSYYGLFSPLIVLSYLFPFVPMGYFVMMTGVVTVYASECIFYFWLRKSYCIRVTAFTTALFAFSMPLIYQTHRHIMFVSFMPFLLLCLQLTDVYFEKGKRWPLVLCAFLMIMCNYFFAVTALFALAAYGFVKVIDKGGSFKDKLKSFFPYICLLFVSVLMAAVLLLPTAYCLFSGRDEGNVRFDFTQFLPSVRLDWLTYYSYSMGLTGFGVYALVYCIFNTKGSKRFISVLTLLFAVLPILVFMLNGGLYFDSKVLFSFLPLALTVVAWLTNDILKNGAQRMLYPLPVFIIGSFLAYVVGERAISMKLYLVDAALTAVIILVLRKRHNVYICSLFLVIAVIGCAAKNSHDEMVKTSVYDLIESKDIAELISDEESDTLTRTAVDLRRVDTPNKIYTASHYQDSIYSSVHSKDYNSFYFNEMYNENEFRNSALTTRSKNIIFNCYMGDGYFVSEKPLKSYGLELVKKTESGYYLYKNENALPLMYHTGRLMSKREYDTLDYPANIEALTKYTVIDEDIPDTGFKTAFKRVDARDIFDIGDILPRYELCELDDKGVRHITLNDQRFKFRAKLPEECKDKIVLIRFHINNPQEGIVPGVDKETDDSVTINGIKNKISNPDWRYFNNNRYFEYVLSDFKDTLDIEMRGYVFELSEFEMYIADPEVIDNMSEGLTAFEFDTDKTKGDIIKGTITAPDDGFVTSSFVYHEGFTVTVDGEQVTPVKTDTAFLGFKVSKGKHDIRITFCAPWQKAGIAVSGVGFAVFFVIVILDIRKRNAAKK